MLSFLIDIKFVVKKKINIVLCKKNFLLRNNAEIFAIA
jgi:hypothetical protein